ncbi:MAG: hypothetical protein EXS17_02305 [Phycisphaerales bacterium]|nr:hypothetical protein [Phycisphaerales bacterium]
MVVTLLCAFVSTAVAQVVPVAVPSSSELAGAYLWQCTELQTPVGCAITRDGLVAVADAAGEVVGLSAVDGAVRWRTSRAGDETLVNPAGIAVLPDGSLLVSDARRGRVDQFSQQGNWIARFAEQVALTRPTSIAVGRRSDGAHCVAIVDDASHEIVIIGQDGIELCRITRHHLQMNDGSNARPSHVAFVAAGALAVSASEQHQLFVLDIANCDSPTNAAPVVQSSWGGRGPFPGLFNQPMGIASDGAWLWIADQFNHRIARQSHTLAVRGEGKLAYGQHAVFPRAGEGAVHYPVAIAVGRDIALGAKRGALAVACEPFERRVQAFVPSASEEPADLRLILPKLAGVQSHFGAAATIAGQEGNQRLFMHDPESATVVAFDLSRGQPIHVSTISGAGTKPHESGRIDALVALSGAQDGPQRLLVADGANRRLALWELTDPPAEVIFEPFMAKLVKTRSYARLDLPADAIIVSLALSGDNMVLALCADGPHIVTLDPSLRTATLLPITAPDTTARAVAIACASDGTIGVLFDTPAMICQYRFESDRWKPVGTVPLAAVAHARNLCAGVAGEWWVDDDANDCIVVVRADGSTATIGSRGVADGAFWLPTACARDARGAMYVVDSGNHRGQRFSSTGEWQLTFSLGRTYTRARGANEVMGVRKAPSALPTQGTKQ